MNLQDKHVNLPSGIFTLGTSASTGEQVILIQLMSNLAAAANDIRNRASHHIAVPDNHLLGSSQTNSCIYSSWDIENRHLSPHLSQLQKPIVNPVKALRRPGLD
jgi:hypothetical protein